MALAHIQPHQIDEQTLIAMQQHMAQQAAFAQIPDVVKGVCPSNQFLAFLHLLYFSVHRSFPSSRAGK
jgi:hypothetical protein